MDEDQGPSQIVPPTKRSRFSLKGAGSTLRRTFLTRSGMLGDYNYAFLFTPNLPFMKKSKQSTPFFGLNDHMPVLLAILLGFQHSLSMLAGIITPPIIMAGAAGGNLVGAQQQYLVSAALIVSGLLSMIQITRFHIYKTQCVCPPLVAALSLSLSLSFSLTA